MSRHCNQAWEAYKKALLVPSSFGASCNYVVCLKVAFLKWHLIEVDIFFRLVLMNHMLVSLQQIMSKIVKSSIT